MTQNTNTTPQPSSAAPAAEISAPKIALVAIDLDGTLLDPSSQLTSANESALKAAIAQGVNIVFATGKTRGSAAAMLKKLKIDAPGIFVQGTVTHNADGSIRSQVTLPDGLVRQALTYMEERGFATAAYSGSRILMRTAHKQLIDNMRQYGEVEPEIVGPLQNLLGKEPINKLIAMGDARAVTALRWQLNLQIGSSARLMQAGIPEMLEVLPNSTSKGSALKRLAVELNIHPDHIMAIGDAENDIEMLQFAGLSVAMGNADDRVKSAAKHTVASNKDDGVAEALRRFVIVKPPKPAAPPAAEAAPVGEAAPAADAVVAETPASVTPASVTPAPAEAPPVAPADAAPPATSAPSEGQAES